jgi:UDP-N-acetylglucosamine 2-epimerase
VSLLTDWQENSVEAQDLRSWLAICRWKNYSSVNTIDQGIDYAELTRSFLWDKVPRAIRKQLHPKSFEFEENLLAASDIQSNVITRKPSLKLKAKRFLQQSQTYRDALSIRANAARHQRPILYIPIAHSKLTATVKGLSQQKTIEIVAPRNDFFSHLPIHVLYLSSEHVFIPNFDAVNRLHQGTLKGLEAQGIELLKRDRQVLLHQLLQQNAHLQRVNAELSILRPQAILVFADNHYPIQNYVFAAKQQSIPVIMLQHGLDCEHYCLDEAYADAIAVWGNARLQRYQQYSIRQPGHIQVTGNPGYDAFCLPKHLNLDGEYWLWTTRPHAPEKCYAPSRHPEEGLAILDALLSELQRSPHQRLIIKPHPLDRSELYQERITAMGLCDRVELTQTDILELLAHASLVIAEDSTSGLEAMFFGKVVIHAHFAQSQPVMPFVQEGAALPATSATSLHAAIQRAQRLTPIEQQQLLEGQWRCLSKQAGLCDGQSGQRVIDFVMDVLLKKNWRKYA